MSNKPELLHCPFCGKQPLPCRHAEIYYRIACVCGILIVRDTEVEAVAAWNQRAASIDRAEVVAENLDAKMLAYRITSRLFRISETAIADEMLIVDKLGKPWAAGSVKDVMTLIYQEIQNESHQRNA